MSELPPLRHVITSHGLGAKKAFGQHFLFDLNLTAKIAGLAGDLDGLIAVEIGPGPGGLTRALLATNAAHVIAIEKDPRFLPALEEAGAHFGDRLTLIEADALTADEAALTGGKPAIIASNLPYNVGTPLLIKWLKANPVWWKAAILMFQKEVADRIVARPGDKAYGRLAVLTAAAATARIGLKVPARAFTPPPKVESAVVVVHPLPADERFEDLSALEVITESAFGQRRKMLRSSLSSAAAKAGTAAETLLAEAGVTPTARAETVSPAGFFRLAEAWRKANG